MRVSAQTHLLGVCAAVRYAQRIIVNYVPRAQSSGQVPCQTLNGR